MTSHAALSEAPLESIVLEGETKIAQIEDAITAGRIDRTIDGASTVRLDIHDPDGRILRSRLTKERVRMSIDGRRFELSRVSKVERSVSFTFEDELVAELRRRDSFRKSAGSMSRLAFARALVREVPGAVFLGPDRKAISAAGRTEKARPPGFGPSPDITIKGKPADAEQTRNLQIMLQTAEPYTRSLGKVGQRFLLECAVAGVTVESAARNLSPDQSDRDSEGIFQQRPSQGWKGLRNIPAATREFFDRLIPAYKASPRVRHTDLVQEVQNSGTPEEYQKWVPEAKETVEAFLGGASGSSLDGGRGEFTRGEPGRKESSWDTLDRLAQEIAWRRFCVDGVVQFTDDASLLAARPVMRIDENDDGVDWIDFDFDPRLPAAEATVRCRAALWVAPPGSVAELLRVGPAEGRWIVQNIGRDLASPECEISLTRPRPALAPPKSSGSPAPIGGDQAAALEGVVLDERYAGTQAIFEQFVTPFMRARGLSPGSSKRPEKWTSSDKISDHWIGATSNYATDYPTNSGEKIARELAEAIGQTGWAPGGFARHTVTVQGQSFSMQILWGDSEHLDHVHAGARRV